jgi:hypothetical protein
MNTTLVVLGVPIAVAAAARSTWSPCGLSMLSSITPLAERSRGHRFGVTATWFVLGATLGGATLGLLSAALAVGVRASGLDNPAACAVAAGLALLCALSDLRPFGLHLPFHGRQVNEVWLSRYRPWVYAGGFGWQIGSGLATYILTAATYLLVALAALTASPGIAIALAVLFGLLRGLAVFLAAGITTPARLHAFHRRFDQLGPSVRRATIGVQLAVAAAAAAVAGGLSGVVIVAVVGGIGIAAVVGPGRAGRDRSTAARPDAPAPVTVD